jgi:O-acetyl-ADP-ribose deacetylase (regulator of RNase III)
MPLQLVRNDITKMSVDVIVNTTNSHLQQEGGVCGAIFMAAGADQLQKACNEIGQCEVGEAVMTEGFNLPAKHIIHTLGPVWHGGNHREEELLGNCYRNSLDLAKNQGAESIAFPLISSGVFGYPKDLALRVAINAISAFVMEEDMMVYLVVYDNEAYALSEKLYNSVEKYIDDHYVEEHFASRDDHRTTNQHNSRYNVSEKNLDYISHYSQESNLYSESSCEAPKMSESRKPKRKLKDLLDQLDDSFSTMLLRLIDEKGLSDVQVYKKANIDRKLFSKIRSNMDYKPSKNTAIALAIAMELNLDETMDLIGRAGYTLSRSSHSDMVIQYFIDIGHYNIFEINATLFEFEHTTLGAFVAS